MRSTGRANRKPAARKRGDNRVADIVKGALISAIYGVLVAMAGTIVHRGGAEWNVPWGLALAFLIVGLSSWNARVRSGLAGLGLHMVAVGIVSYAMAGSGPGGDILVPVGGESLVTFFSKHAGYIWLLGAIAVQLAVLMMPERWFRALARDDGEDDGGARRGRARKGRNGNHDDGLARTREGERA